MPKLSAAALRVHSGTQDGKLPRGRLDALLTRLGAPPGLGEVRGAGGAGGRRLKKRVQAVLRGAKVPDAAVLSWKDALAAVCSGYYLGDAQDAHAAKASGSGSVTVAVAV